MKCEYVGHEWTRCRANAPSGAGVWPLHNTYPVKRATLKARSTAGGIVKAAIQRAFGAPLAEDPAVVEIDLTTLRGLRDVRAANLRVFALSQSDVKLANALINALIAQQSIVEMSALVEHVAAFKAVLKEAGSY